MGEISIVAVGDNVADKYISRGLMYPGGQCVNTCVYAKMCGADTAYLGKFGTDRVAAHNKAVLDELGIDYSRSRTFEGENGYARVTLQDGDRVFLGSNKGGVSKEHPWDFDADDLAYISKFSLIYTNLNSYIEDDLPLLASIDVPIAYDFSTRWTDEYLDRVCPHIQYATLSCAHLTDEERKREMEKVASLGVRVVLGTVGEHGSHLLYDGHWLSAAAVLAGEVRDTMGAGDSFFASFLTEFMRTAPEEGVFAEADLVLERLRGAMDYAAAFAAKSCAMEGAFGYGVPIEE